ncbi:MAG: GMC family oxidoreductase [Magnetococcales bacterium]|nr:GMC family oxidoreductase [Magnetococcales bacterium]
MDSSTVIIGSGLAALWCAKACIARGLRPLILDGGDTLDASRQSLIDRLRATPPTLWSTADRLAIQDTPRSDRRLPKKRVFGSDYLYAHTRLNMQRHNATGDVTLALGGFSNAWAGALFPMIADDMQQWPLSREALDPAYRRVLQEIPLSTAEDDLQPFFPSHAIPCPALPDAAQITLLKHRLQRHRLTLQQHGLLFGQSRLAIRAAADNHSPGCQLCGNCLSGCPTGAVYNAGQEMLRLQQRGEVDYRPGMIVDWLEERDTTVQLHGRHADDTPFRLACSRLFLAAGALGSSRILIHSPFWSGEPLRLVCSDKFFVPCLQGHGVPGIVDEARHVFPGLFLLLRNEGISPCHLLIQVSPMNALAMNAVGLNPVTMGSRMKRLLNPLLSRGLFFWGSLHSRDSSHLEVHRGETPTGPWRVVGRENEGSGLIVKRLMRLFRGLRRQTGFVPLGMAAMLAGPGAGNHLGGSFPMVAGVPQRGQSDLLGRPGGLQRVHLVDSSTFPSVTGTTIGLTIMANAWRIGSEAPEG